MSSQVLVTGAAGRLGRAVSELLHREGYELVTTDIVDSGTVPYSFRQADLLDHSTASELLDGIDVVVHLGNHPGLGGRPPQVVFNQNMTMNTNVFQAAAERGVRRIIFASTLQLVGSHVDSRTVVSPPPLPGFPIDGSSPAHPANLYALSKTLAEQMLQYYADRCGVDCVALRLPLLHNFDERIWVDTGAETTIDLAEGFTGLSYGDAARLFLAVLRSDLPGYRSYMAGTAHRHRDLDVDALVRTFYPQLGNIRDLIDNGAVRAETGWEIADDYQHFTSQDHTK